MTLHIPRGPRFLILLNLLQAGCISILTAWLFTAKFRDSTAECGMLARNESQAVFPATPSNATATTLTAARPVWVRVAVGGRTHEGPLRWRTVPYGKLPRTEYGGELVAMAFQDAGFEPPVEGDDWDVLFSHSAFVQELVRARLPARPGRRLAHHCDYFRAAGHKCLFAEHVHRVEEAHGRNWTSGQRRHLLTFALDQPQQAKAWAQAARADPAGHWVVKTCGGGNAQAVRVVAGADEAAIRAAAGTQAVAQEYVRRPLKAFGERKWHLRAYVLATSWAPVRAFFFQQGLIRAGSKRHDPSKPAQADLFSGGGGLYTLEWLWKALGLQRAAVAKAKLASTLRELFGTELLRTFGDFHLRARGRSFECFDLFGVDVMFGEDLSPYILEVNQGPNLWGDSEQILWAVRGSVVRHVAGWAAWKAKLQGPLSMEEEEAIENVTLRTFVRIL